MIGFMTLFAAIEPVGNGGAATNTPAIYNQCENLWQSFEKPYGLWIFFGVGLACTLWGLYLCWRIYSLVSDGRKRSIKGFFHSIPAAISHVPHSTISAIDHIKTGLFLFAGVSIMAGFLAAKIIHSQESTAGYMVTNAGLVLGTLTLTLTLWVLWQTRKLERLQGEDIDRFDGLIKNMTEELGNLVERYDENRDKSLSLFRVYLVTNNPYFGVISFPGKAVTDQFMDAFDGLCRRVKTFRDNQDPTKGEGFKVKIICANEEHLKKFNSNYFGNGEDVELKKSIDDSETFIKHLKDSMGEDSVIRIPLEIDEAQFAVVGDVVFEFFLESPNASDSKRSRGSEIRNTNRVQDRTVAARFERYTRFLEKLILKNGQKVSPGGEVLGQVIEVEKAKIKTEGSEASKDNQNPPIK